MAGEITIYRGGKEIGTINRPMLEIEPISETVDCSGHNIYTPRSFECTVSLSLMGLTMEDVEAMRRQQYCRNYIIIDNAN